MANFCIFVALPPGGGVYSTRETRGGWVVALVPRGVALLTRPGNQRGTALLACPGNQSGTALLVSPGNQSERSIIWLTRSSTWEA